MIIEITQGDDSPIYKFQRKNLNQEIITTKAQNAYVTIKKNTYTKKYLFQKRLDDETITFNESDNFYRFQIKSEDTQDLPYGKYKFDIAIKDENGDKKTLKKGTLEVVEHCTFKENE